MESRESKEAKDGHNWRGGGGGMCQYEREGKEGEKQREGNRNTALVLQPETNAIEDYDQKEKSYGEGEGKREKERKRKRKREVQVGVTSQAGGAVFPLSTWERAGPVILVPAVSGAGQRHRTP